MVLICCIFRRDRRVFLLWRKICDIITSNFRRITSAAVTARKKMFTGFTQKTSEFMWELAFNNERPWFVAHKAEFEEYVNTPFKALANETMSLFEARCPGQQLRLHISRIYRDARRLFGRGPYKDHLWFSIKYDDELLEGPMFWFEVGKSDYSYGMGFYAPTPDQMEAFRRSIDANPAYFERIAAPIMADSSLRVYGEEYKRPKGKHEGDIIDFWYNRKHIGIEVNRDFGGDVLSAELPRILAETYEKLLPMYEYFLEFYKAAPPPERRR